MTVMKTLVASLLVLGLGAGLAACEPKAGPASNTAGPGTSTTREATPKPGRVDPPTVPTAVKMRAASGKTGKYSNAIAAIYAPEDEKDNSPFSEYGWRDATESYKNVGPMPGGWWVYASPYWVIWDLKDGQRGP